MLTKNFPAKKATRRYRAYLRLCEQLVDAPKSQTKQNEREIEVLSSRELSADSARAIRTKKDRRDRAKLGR
jgi:hypothetical protein